MGSRLGSIVHKISVFSTCNSCGCFHLTARLVTHTRTMSARVSAFSAAELRSAAEATTRYGRAGVDDSDTERASVSPRCDENADDVGTRPHPLFGLTRAERAFFDASGSPMRSNATNYGSITVDVADTNEDEEEETGEGREERSSGWLAGIGHSRRGRGRVTVAAVACLAMCGVGAMALALAPPEVRASVASSLGLRIPTSPKPGFVEAKAEDLSPLGEQQQRPGPDRSKPVTSPRDAHVPKHPPTNTFEPRRNGYLVGLTTSAGFGDQFKRLSTYASMARELDRTLVLWPVWTSPHYDLGPDSALGPLRFSDYVQVYDGDASDVPNRVVRYEDAPVQVRDFARSHPKACVTSNNLGNDVQFLTSANLSDAIVAPSDGTDFQSFETLRDGFKKHAAHGPEPRDTVCLAATFSPQDYNNPRHAETVSFF